MIEKVIIKADQIMDVDTLQTGESVLAMVEAFLTALESDKRFDFLTETIISSDNAACYHKKLLSNGIPFLNLVPGRRIRISRLIHTETQEGKGLLDAHFARGTRQVFKYIKTCKQVENKKVGTSGELAGALAWNGGIQNSIVQHVRVDREFLKTFEESMDSCSTAALDYYSRANDCFYVDELNNSNFLVTDSRSWNSVYFRV